MFYSQHSFLVNVRFRSGLVKKSGVKFTKVIILFFGPHYLYFFFLLGRLMTSSLIFTLDCLLLKPGLMPQSLSSEVSDMRPHTMIVQNQQTLSWAWWNLLRLKYLQFFIKNSSGRNNVNLILFLFAFKTILCKVTDRQKSWKVCSDFFNLRPIQLLKVSCKFSFVYEVNLKCLLF